MKLHEKICYCRKKAGLSQEALAEKIGVSRQAVSKWETGDAVPEIGKLPLLAKTFGVTADWLLSEDEPHTERAPEYQPRASRDWVDRFSDSADRITCRATDFFKRHGWICGILLTAYGIFRFLSTVIPLLSFPSGMIGTATAFGFGSILTGIASTVGGIVLTVVLKKWCKNNRK